MGLLPTLARILICEHIYKPINGKVLCLGRQTIPFTHKEAVELISQEGYHIPSSVIAETARFEDRNTRTGKGKGYISDVAFFKLLGITDLTTMDVSSYENAEIVHSLNDPIPKSLEGKFDFIIDGGTFDHLFDLRVAFTNVTKMLKPGGRIFQWNATSNYTGAAYISFGPDMFYDYFILNNFEDCKVWLAEEANRAGTKWIIYDFEGRSKYSHIKSRHPVMTIVLAEKGSNTTWNKVPTQSQYRDPDLWAAYKEGKLKTLNSTRKPLCGHKSFSYLGSNLGGVARIITGKQMTWPWDKGYRYVGII